MTNPTSSHAMFIDELFALMLGDRHVVRLTDVACFRLIPDVMTCRATVVVYMRDFADRGEISPVVGLAVRTEHAERKGHQ